MKKIIINSLSVFVIVTGSYLLSQPATSYANSVHSLFLIGNAKCSCATGDECEGECCRCTALGCSAGPCSVIYPEEN